MAEDPKRIVPLELDITRPGQIRRAAGRARDVHLLVNNAGSVRFAGLIAAESLEAARAEMEINYFGTLAVTRAFAPILGANGGGAIVNVLAAQGLVNLPLLGSGSASKAAAHSMTQGVRAELAAQGTRVVGVYVGLVDTDLTSHLDVPKGAPAQVAEAALGALADGGEDVFPDAAAVEIRDGLARDPKSVERRLAAMTP